MRRSTRALVVAVVALFVVVATAGYAYVATRRMEYLCSTDGFPAVHFTDWPAESDEWGYGLSLFPPGAYCEMYGERVVQFFPRMPSEEALAEHGFG